MENETVIRPTINTPEKVKKARWRKGTPNSRKKMKRKERRNNGSPYVSERSKKKYEAKQLGPKCNCKKRCWNMIEGEECNIFNAFWDLSDFNTQNAYLFSSIKVNATKRKYMKKRKHADESRRGFTYSYHVNVLGKTLDICRDEFLSLHGLHNNRGRLRNIQKMVVKGVLLTDGRGRHSNRPKKYSDQDVENVRKHIQLIPRYQSHYSRKQNPRKVYLNCDLTIESLYKVYYVPWCNENGHNAVSRDKYRRIFCTEFNIGFKIPQSDTCKTCDQLTVAVENARTTGNDVELRKFETEHKAHLMKAEGMKNMLKDRSEESKKTPELHVITMDLQQALPTPMLSAGPAFYKRKLWTFNFGIHDCSKDRGYMFLWNESVAKRGSDEVASCILKYLQCGDVKNAKHLVVFSDNCPGQNKNWTIMALWHHLVTSGKFESVQHCFLIPGHTLLPSDRDFAKIEKFKRAHYGNVYTTTEWRDIILRSNKRAPFMAIDMKQDDFFNATDCFVSKIRKITTDDDGHALGFSKIHTFKFSAETPGVMQVQFSVYGDPVPLKIAKRGRPLDVQLRRKYEDTLQIDSKKLRDLQDMLKYIPPLYHPFFNELKPMDDQPMQAEDGNDDTLIDVA